MEGESSSSTGEAGARAAEFASREAEVRRERGAKHAALWQSLVRFPAVASGWLHPAPSSSSEIEATIFVHPPPSLSLSLSLSPAPLPSCTH
jgi:hypothetical protein